MSSIVISLCGWSPERRTECGSSVYGIVVDVGIVCYYLITRLVYSRCDERGGYFC